MFERQESGSVIDKVAAPEVLRRIAAHLEVGGSQLNSISFRAGQVVNILCKDSASWAEWVGEFDGHPIDAAYEKGVADPSLTFAIWSGPGVEVEYIIRPVES